MAKTTAFYFTEGSHMLHEAVTSDIINAFYQVYNTLGYGFLEKVYENAMAKELARRGHRVKQQTPIQVYYLNEAVGEYFADIMIEDKIILELKVAEAISPAHEAQLINYLKATGIQVGFVFNFGPQATFKRKIFTKGDTQTHKQPVTGFSKKNP